MTFGRIRDTFRTKMIDRENYFSFKNSEFLGWGNIKISPRPELRIFIGENDEPKAL